MVSAFPVPGAHAFYGSIEHLDGSPVMSGTIVAEVGNDSDSAGIVNGTYGYGSDVLLINSDTGGIVHFYIQETGEELGTHGFVDFEVTRLDFVVSGGVPPSNGGGSGGGGDGALSSHRETGYFVYCGDGEWEEDECDDYNPDWIFEEEEVEVIQNLGQITASVSDESGESNLGTIMIGLLGLIFLLLVLILVVLLTRR